MLCRGCWCRSNRKQPRALLIPVLGLAGARDTLSPPELVRAADNRRGADFHLICDAGHIPGVELAKQTYAEIEAVEE